MNAKKWIAGALAAGMLLTTNLMITEAAEMTEKKEAVKVVQTAGRDKLGDFAPDFAKYNARGENSESCLRNPSMHFNPLFNKYSLRKIVNCII